MDFRVLSAGLSICQLPLGAVASAPFGEFFSLTRTGGELSLVCSQPPLECLRVEAGWSALEIVGTLDFALTGILASFAVPLAASGIAVFAISTFDTDYVLVKTERLDAALAALVGAGHTCI